MVFKSGFITIVGRPNVGKSTLLNLLTGEKVAIMSNKPQTTRHIIRTVLTTEEYQMVFVDTPGIHKPKNKLGQYMMQEALSTFEGVDLILFMVDARDKKIGPGDSMIIEEIEKAGLPAILLINKIDLAEKDSLLPLIAQYNEAYDFDEIIPVSALDSRTRTLILDAVKKLLPEGDLYYPEDMLTDQQEKVIAQELIREKLLNLLSDEVPHGIGVEVIRFKEKDDKEIIEIDANIYCEKESHKGIIIGKGGKVLKRAGTLARQDMERLFDSKVFLQLWVKVKDDWRNDDFMLNELGYNEKKGFS
ncbi:MAG: GTPase Era [Clostridiaceae bacterium]|jgi:GTP-binding protein Era|nr:GTPase Era [Clostridiaceae bacterium]